MKNILLSPNPLRDKNYLVTKAAAEILNSEGLSLFMTDILASGEDIPRYVEIIPGHKAMENIDLVMCFGGDGTILYSAREAARRGIPILGVNVGNTGFIVELERNELELLKKLKTDEYTMDLRMMLSVKIVRGGETVYSCEALNDAVVNKGAISRMLNLEVFADNKKMTVFSGDGLIISTPTGSTAYSMSAGGPIVEPQAENIIFTPICAHALNIKALVLAHDRSIVVKHDVLAENTAYLSVDGGNAVMLKSYDEVHVEKSGLYTRLIRLNRRSFYEIMNNKLNKA